MDKPKTMAKSMTGRNDSTGPVEFTPSREPSQPHWKKATSIPNAAPIEKMFNTADMRGMTRLRKTTASNRKDNSTTRPMNRGNLADSTLAKSTNRAVEPPTYTVSAD